MGLVIREGTVTTTKATTAGCELYELGAWAFHDHSRRVTVDIL